MLDWTWDEVLAATSDLENAPIPEGAKTTAEWARAWKTTEAKAMKAIKGLQDKRIMQVGERRGVNIAGRVCYRPFYFFKGENGPSAT